MLKLPKRQNRLGDKAMLKEIDAGWEVWFANDLDGSYEGLPPNLTEYAKHDRHGKSIQ